MSRLIFLIAFIFSVPLFSQHIDSIDRKLLDSSLQKNLVKGYYWKDKRGDNRVLLYKSMRFEKIEGGTQMRYVDFHAVNLRYLEKDNMETVWELNDSQEKCHEVNDLTARFITDSFSLTDLDNDGVCEVWFMYKMSCRTDISPARLKLVMYEGTKKYVIVGHTRVGRRDKQYLGGDHELDANFNGADQKLVEYGLDLWEKFINEDWK